MNHVDILNRRLGDRLGRVCGGTVPRFVWKYAPDVPWIVYDRDDRSLLRKTWAEAPGADGRLLGKVWVIAEWRLNRSIDHFGYGSGVRIAVANEAGYTPYFETALIPGQAPTDELTALMIVQIERQLEVSAGIIGHEKSENHWLTDTKYAMESQDRRAGNDHLERSRHIYDNHVGAFGNCDIGKRDGFFSFQNVESGPEMEMQRVPAIAAESTGGV